MTPQFDTSLGMLGRVQAGDDHAWTEFATRAASIVRHWARWKRLQVADAEDLTHDALLVVFSKIQNFKHSGRGSFRAWLRAIAWRCLCEAHSEKEDLARPELAERYREAEDQIAELDEEFDRLQQLDVLKSCMVTVQRRVQAQTWDAFRLVAIEGLSGPAAASQLSMQLDAVHAARGRVQKLIAIEMRRRRNHLQPEE